MQGLLVLVMYIWDFKKFTSTFFPESLKAKEEQPVETEEQPGKKNKKNKKKNIKQEEAKKQANAIQNEDIIAVLTKQINNMNAKIFEDK